MANQKIKKLRGEIDRIDRELLRLISKRGNKASEIGRIKRALRTHFYVPEREEKILGRLKKMNSGPFGNEAVATVFREILSASLALELPLKVAYLGPEATFTHLAGIKRFGLSAQFIPQPTIQQVFKEVELKRVDFGVIPIENSTEGVVSYTLDLFAE